VNFLGATVGLAREAARQPRLARPRELTVQLEQTGLNAIPVVALVTLLIGIVIAYLLACRPRSTAPTSSSSTAWPSARPASSHRSSSAVIVAGRSGAAFTAQLGAMRLTEEIDAIRTLGLSPLQVLVVPRVLALMITLPLLVFVGDVMSLLGAMAIAGPMPRHRATAFMARLHESLDPRHVFIGLVKAPVFALSIAVIGTRMGHDGRRDTAPSARPPRRPSCRASSRSSCSTPASPWCCRRWTSEDGHARGHRSRRHRDALWRAGGARTA